jgi:hypothetical protein
MIVPMSRPCALLGPGRRVDCKKKGAGKHGGASGLMRNRILGGIPGWRARHGAQGKDSQ